MSYISKRWKPVNVSKLRQTTSGGSMGWNAQNNWYNNLVSNTEDYKKRLERYDLMDSSTVDVSRALDIIAEDISSDGAEDNDIFNIDFPEEAEVKPNTSKTLNRMLRKWEETTEFDYRFFDYVREAIKYGGIFFRVNNDGSLTKLPLENFAGVEVDKKDTSKVVKYLYVDPAKQDPNKKELEAESIKVENMLIMKVGDEPYGTSVLEKVYRIWKQLQLLEDAVVIYRIVRAPERRVFYIDIGRMSATKSESYIERIRARMNQKQISKNNKVETEYNPSSMQEDFYIATTSEGKGSRVETLPGGDNLGRIEDLQYFNKKLALGLRIPPSYLDSYSDSSMGGGQQYNDGRVGTAYIAELRYVGFVKRIQKAFSKNLYLNYKKFIEANDVKMPEDIIFQIEPPQSFAEYRLNDLNSTLMNTFMSAENLRSFSKQYALEKFMQMDKDEVFENEVRKLMEMGHTEAQARKMKPHERMQKVYGEEDPMGGGFGGGFGGGYDPAPAPEPKPKEEEKPEEEENPVDPDEVNKEEKPKKKKEKAKNDN